MKTVLFLAVGALLLASIAVSSTGLSATKHRSYCHTRHTCPSDHHTYKWKDPRTGKRWNCVSRTADEYNSARDEQRIKYDGRTYYCRAA
jgi:hypothetical protein